MAISYEQHAQNTSYSAKNNLIYVIYVPLAKSLSYISGFDISLPDDNR